MSELTAETSPLTKFTLVLDEGEFKGLEVRICQVDQQVCVEHVKGMSKRGAWKQFMIKYKNVADTSISRTVNRYFAQHDIALYCNYLKKKLGKQLEINTDKIVKDLALAYHTTPSDFVDHEGKRKAFKDINPLALQTVKIDTLKFDKNGEPSGAFSFTPMSKFEVLKFLNELSEIDTDFVKTLKSKVTGAEVKLNRTK